ncbi:MAG: coproporphyrinogen dehydrogenase HemZ [Clostridia bacterium]|nr:coproporphyrinogen dehydrogenase HemZ [Clostridia bacterium]
MKIECIGHTFETAVRQIIQLFFSLKSDVYVKSAMLASVTETVIKYDGREARAVSFAPPEASRTEQSDSVKRSCFEAAVKLSDMPAPWGISTGIRPAKSIRALHKQGLSYTEAKEAFARRYLADEEKALLAARVAQKEDALLNDMYPDGVSVYIGIPFCPTRCAYCSFISQSAERSARFVEPYLAALAREIEAAARTIKRVGKRLETLYFGGGTPTVLSQEQLHVLFSLCEKMFDFSSLREFTVEAGRPDTICTAKLSELKAAGVNRISINPQTMKQQTLDTIGRRHGVEDVYNAFDIARAGGFDNINADIIVGLPNETEADVSQTMSELLSLSPEAVTIHTMYLKRAAYLIDEFERYRFCEGTRLLMNAAVRALADYEPYYLYKQKNTLGNLENVGFAKEGCECRYNVYIMEEEQTILALGAGASSKIVKDGLISRIYNPKDAREYILRIDDIVAQKEGIL